MMQAERLQRQSKTEKGLADSGEAVSMPAARERATA